MTRQYSSDNENLYRTQEIVSPYTVENKNKNSSFSSRWRKYYKRDKDFSPEERSKILARVSEVGATRAADEFGTRRWVIMQWLDNLEKFGSIDNPKRKNKKYKNKKREFTKQNSAPQKMSAPIEIENETDFEFNFDGILEQDKNDTQPIEAPEELYLKNHKLKASNDFTLEEREKILELSYEIGIKNAAFQAHTKIDVIKYWRKLEKKSAKIKHEQTAAVDPVVAENKILKAKIDSLKAEANELAGKILSSLNSGKH